MFNIWWGGCYADAIRAPPKCPDDVGGEEVC